MHIEQMDREVKKCSDLMGKTVLFTDKDAGRKFLEARNMALVSVPLVSGLRKDCYLGCWSGGGVCGG